MPGQEGASASRRALASDEFIPPSLRRRRDASAARSTRGQDRQAPHAAAVSSGHPASLAARKDLLATSLTCLSNGLGQPGGDCSFATEHPSTYVPGRSHSAKVSAGADYSTCGCSERMRLMGVTGDRIVGALWRLFLLPKPRWRRGGIRADRRGLCAQAKPGRRRPKPGREPTEPDWSTTLHLTRILHAAWRRAITPPGHWWYGNRCSGLSKALLA